MRNLFFLVSWSATFEVLTQHFTDNRFTIGASLANKEATAR
jgi:hypothetical protein